MNVLLLARLSYIFLVYVLLFKAHFPAYSFQEIICCLVLLVCFTLIEILDTLRGKP